MFRWKQQPLSALLPDLPDVTQIEQDLSDAAADDVVFVTRIPDFGDNRPVDFSIRFSEVRCGARKNFLACCGDFYVIYLFFRHLIASRA
jgi:hypothetical protein